MLTSLFNQVIYGREEGKLAIKADEYLLVKTTDHIYESCCFIGIEMGYSLENRQNI